MGKFKVQGDLTIVQKKALELLSFKYGNGGSCHTKENHKFLQLHIAGTHDEAEMLGSKITDECRTAFEKVMKSDYSELHEDQREFLKGIEKFGTW
jgi:hypothetical protein